MADYPTEMKAIEALMKQEDEKRMAERGDMATNTALASIGSNLFGTGDVKGAQQAWTGGSQGRLDESALRQKRLMEKYKATQAMAGKESARANKLADAKNLIDYRNKVSGKGPTAKGKPLSVQNILKVNEGNAIPKTLDTISDTIVKNKDMFGPIEGRVRSYNPYDEKAQVLDAEIRAASQQFGRFMEGGVLRKEDEAKYRKMFPAMSDTPGIAKGKLDVVRRLLKRKQESDLKALRSQGFDLTGLEMPVTKNAPAVASTKKELTGDMFTDGPISDLEAAEGQQDELDTLTDQQIDDLYSQEVGM